ncbi:MAG TPA: SsrA-binding protein SmpB [Patescibacteria group bacterium]|jgi:SsrA-binding protein
MKLIAKNRRARHDYVLERTYEAGIALTGGEVKSVKDGGISIQEAYVSIRGGEAWLLNAHVKPWHGADGEPDPTRERKLLLHREELSKLVGETREKGRTIVPTAVGLSKGLVKLEIALARGKQSRDKRQTLKQRQAEREAAQAMKRSVQRDA